MRLFSHISFSIVRGFKGNVIDTSTCVGVSRLTFSCAGAKHSMVIMDWCIVRVQRGAVGTEGIKTLRTRTSIQNGALRWRWRVECK